MIFILFCYFNFILRNPEHQRDIEKDNEEVYSRGEGKGRMKRSRWDGLGTELLESITTGTDW